MDTVECLLTRRSFKKYTNKPVEESLLNQIAECGKFAASGKGMQSPIILKITNIEIRNELAKINAKIMGIDNGFDPFYGAPALFVVLVPKDSGTGIYDGTLALGNMMNCAHALGLGSCWIHRAKEEFESEYGKKILRDLGIPEDYIGVGNLVVGYNDGPAANRKPRKENYVYEIK